MRRGLRLGALLAALCAGARDGGAQEIAPFRLTGVDGQVSMRYLTDANATDTSATGSVGAARVREAISDLRTEIYVMTHSYVYHPNLLLLDIGGGPILQRGRFASEPGETRSSGTLYNLSGRATLLRDKPYRGSFYYEHLNPTLSVAPGQILNQESTRYGFDLALLDPVTPVPLLLDASRSRFKGRAADRIIDDMIDRVNLRASRSFGALGATQVLYQASRQESQSGSPNLPIQASRAGTEAISADTRLQFGTDRRYTLVNLISSNRQRYEAGTGPVPERRDAQVFLDLRAAHGAELNSFATFQHNTSDQGLQTAKRQFVAGGTSYVVSPQLTSSAGARLENNRTTQFDTRAWGLDGSARYQRELPVGTGQASYTVNFERRDQHSSAPQAQVVGERATLQGTAPVALSRPRVVAGSVTVSNANRTQTFTEGFDYLLSIVGLETRIQRLIGGNIADGQEVLVDYANDVGGTYAYRQLNQNLNLSWSPNRYVNAYFRSSDSSPRLESGEPTFPLNTVRSRTLGVRADVPISAETEAWVGGSAEREDRRETISPYRRTAADVYLQTEEPVFGAGTLRVTARRARVAYEALAAQNVNLRGVDLRLFSRHPAGIDLSADAGYERDSGGNLPRSRAFAALKAQWRYRKATLSAELQSVKESQGGVERSRTVAQLVFRRDL